MAQTIALTHNLKRDPKPDQPQDFYAEYDTETTIEAIEHALKTRGYRVSKIEADTEVLEKLRKLKPYIVYNIAEGLRGESRESHIPAICEMLGIPYTGSGPLTQAICLNKARTKEILSFHGIPTPNFQVYKTGKEPTKLKYPLIVKPVHEGSGVGITKKSIVRDKKELEEQVTRIITEYMQPALVEEYLSGREFTVSILGNENPRILPIVEIKVDQFPEETKGVYGYEAKYVYDRIDLSEKAVLPEKLKEKIGETALKTYKILECRDFGRIDIRLDEREVPNVIDVNPLAGISPSKDPLDFSYFTKAAEMAGIEYKEMINQILNNALRRYGRDGT